MVAEERPGTATRVLPADISTQGRVWRLGFTALGFSVFKV